MKIKKIGDEFLESYFQILFENLFGKNINSIMQLTILFVLLLFARSALEKIVTSDLFLPLQIILVLYFFSQMAIIVGFIATENTRKKYLGLLYKKGFWWPVLFSLFVLYFSTLCFASLFYLLYKNYSTNIIPINQVNEVNFFTLQDFFFWHFLDAIPIFKIPETILFDIPYLYTDSFLGWLLLAFKLLVFYQILAAFSVSIKLIK